MENINLINEERNNDNKIVKFFKGIKIYIHLIRYGTYHWGFQMIVLYGLFQSLNQINNIAIDLSPHLVKGGEIK